MIKFIASTIPVRNDSFQVFVSYRDYLFWFTCNTDGSVMSGLKPGRTVEECLQAFDHDLEDYSEISEKFVEYIPIKTKQNILTYLIKNKNNLDVLIQNFENLIKEQQL